MDTNNHTIVPAILFGLLITILLLLLISGYFQEASSYEYAKVTKICKQDSISLNQFQVYFKDKELTIWEARQITQSYNQRCATHFLDSIK